MAGINVVFDCADPDALARFWMVALPGYNFPGSPPDVPGGPPEGYASWEAWAEAHEIPQEQRYSGRTIIDQTGNRPDIHFLKVPEPKAGKNRLHLDVTVGRGFQGGDKRARQDGECARLVAAGATVVRRVEEPTGSWLVMQDVEGNEFCLT